MDISNYFTKLKCYCYKLYNTIYGIIAGLYNVYIKDRLLYYFPLEIKAVFDKKNKHISMYDRNKTYSPKKNYEFIYKINKVYQNNGKLYNRGYYYHVSDTDTKYFNPEPDFAYQPGCIESINIKLHNETEKFIIRDCVEHKFISHIMKFSTKDSKLSTLLYFYLQTHLGKSGSIVKFKLKIDECEFKIKHNKKLGDIYSEIEKKMDETD
jgi:hypothetical protein